MSQFFLFLHRKPLFCSLNRRACLNAHALDLVPSLKSLGIARGRRPALRRALATCTNRWRRSQATIPELRPPWRLCAHPTWASRSRTRWRSTPANCATSGSDTSASWGKATAPTIDRPRRASYRSCCATRAATPLSRVSRVRLLFGFAGIELARNCFKPRGFELQILRAAVRNSPVVWCAAVPGSNPIPCRALSWVKID